MADPFVAEIRIFPFNFAPTGWATCDGQLLPISQNTALFSLLGTTYGGDGQTTFALPDLRGRVPVHQVDRFALGNAYGEETVTLSIDQIPAHDRLVRDLHLLAADGDGHLALTRVDHFAAEPLAA